MKRLLLGILIGIGICFPLWTVDWKACMPFADCTYGVSPHSLDSYDLSHFNVEIPKFSSEHFLFRDGFGDVDEYWSFVLPPDLARKFVDSHVDRMRLPRVDDMSGIEECVLGGCEHEDWSGEYWFDRFEDLTEIYYEKYYFCGYSEKKNRIYLMNWND